MASKSTFNVHLPIVKRTVLPGSEKAPIVKTLPTIAGAAGKGAPLTAEKPAPAAEKVVVSVVVKRKTPLKTSHTTGNLRLTQAQYRQAHGADPVAVKLVRQFAKDFGLTVEPDTPGPE